MDFKLTSGPVTNEEALKLANELEQVLGEVGNGTRKATHVPIGPLAGLVRFVRDTVGAGGDTGTDQSKGTPGTERPLSEPESWADRGWSSYVTIVEVEFQHLVSDPESPEIIGPRPDRLHPGLNMAVTAISSNGLLAWMPDGSVVHTDWSTERQCFVRRDNSCDLSLADVRAWGALAAPVAKS